MMGRLGRLARACAVLPALSLRAAPASAAKPPLQPKAPSERTMAPPTKDFRLKEGFFSCKVPADWKLWRDEADDAADKTYGIVLKGPRTAGVAARITVFYYDPANRSFPSAGDYVKAQLGESPLGPDGLKRGPVEEIEVAGRKAQRFWRQSREFVPPDAVRAADVLLRQERVVVATSRGFFVLSLEVPETAFQRRLPVFEGVLATFRPFPQSK